MALSQDEQRVLAEIERRLAAEDPGLASSLATFRRPGAASVMRSPRARIIGSVFTVLLVAMVSLMVYAMIPFRAQHGRTPPTPSAASQDRATISVTASTSQLHGAMAPSATGGIPVNTSVSAPNSATPSSRASSARARSSASSQATGRSTPAVGSP
jgi:Protein of unknown function (DUF3040)